MVLEGILVILESSQPGSRKILSYVEIPVPESDPAIILEPMPSNAKIGTPPEMTPRQSDSVAIAPAADPPGTAIVGSNRSNTSLSTLDRSLAERSAAVIPPASTRPKQSGLPVSTVSAPGGNHRDTDD